MRDECNLGYFPGHTFARGPPDAVPSLNKFSESVERGAPTALQITLFALHIYEGYAVAFIIESAISTARAYLARVSLHLFSPRGPSFLPRGEGSLMSLQTSLRVRPEIVPSSTACFSSALLFFLFNIDSRQQRSLRRQVTLSSTVLHFFFSLLLNLLESTIVCKRDERLGENQ